MSFQMLSVLQDNTNETVHHIHFIFFIEIMGVLFQQLLHTNDDARGTIKWDQLCIEASDVWGGTLCKQQD
jgi:hypothetical protein